jgi:hypothetical protein
MKMFGEKRKIRLLIKSFVPQNRPLNHLCHKTGQTFHKKSKYVRNQHPILVQMGCCHNPHPVRFIQKSTPTASKIAWNACGNIGTALGPEATPEIYRSFFTKINISQ